MLWNESGWSEFVSTVILDIVDVGIRVWNVSTYMNQTLQGSSRINY